MIPQEVALVSSLKRPNGPRHICLFNAQPPRIQESTSVRHLTQFQLQLIFMFLEVRCFKSNVLSFIRTRGQGTSLSLLPSPPNKIYF